jgi:transposase
MKEYIALDAHKHYSLAEREPVTGAAPKQTRLPHARGTIRAFLADAEPLTPVAVEAMGNWYRIMEEIEQAGCTPLLVHPRKAKLMMGCINKTDKLDVHGLNRLQRTGTLPCVWIPPGHLRDLRELTRTRMTFSRMRATLKNRIQSSLAKYFLNVADFSDVFGKGARKTLEAQIAQLPPMTRFTAAQMLAQLDSVSERIAESEAMIRQMLRDHGCVFPTIGNCEGGNFQWLETRDAQKLIGDMRLLTSLPGVAEILSCALMLELGTIDRFADDEHLASYAGGTPRVASSGGKTHFGRLRPDVNGYVKWALIEAANSIVLNHRRKPQLHVSGLYLRLKKSKGHAKAVGALVRHLAESIWHMLKKQEAYRERNLKQQTACSTGT